MAELFFGVGFEDNPDNFTDYVPYICKGSDVVVDCLGDIILLQNNAICGDYMIYCPADDAENEWLNEVK